MSIAPTTTTVADFERQFPLPLSAIEAFMLTDAQPGYPMMCDLELHLEGRICRTAFDEALEFALSRAPLFRATIKTDSKGGHSWVQSEQQPEVVWTEDEEPTAEWHEPQLDLTKEIGLKIWVKAGGPRSSILLHFHHSCADALGGSGFFEDLAVGYANARHEAEPETYPRVEPRYFNAARLSMRGDNRLETRNFWQKLTDPFIGAWKGYRFIYDRPLPISNKTCSPELPRGSGEPAPRYSDRATSEELLAGLRRTSKAAGGTVNDVLLRDMFLTMARWNDAAGEAPAKRYLRILMPQNLRDEADAGIPTANVVGFAPVTRRVSECSDRRKLLRSICAETKKIRKGQYSRYTNGGLALLQAKGALPWLLHNERCLASVILTNIGNPFRHFNTPFPKTGDNFWAGDLKLVGISGVPGIRPLTRGVIAVLNMGNSLTFSSKFDRSSFAPEDGKRFLDAYFAQLQESACETGT